MTRSKLRKIASTALEKEYGFAPARLCEIALLAYNSDGTYILFMVRDKTYCFNSYAYGGITAPIVWTGEGTITRA